MSDRAHGSVPRLPLRLQCCGHFFGQPDPPTVRDNPIDFLVMWVLAGRGFVELGRPGRRRIRRNVEAGDLVTMAPGVAQRYGSDARSPWEILWMHVAGPSAASMVEALRRYGRPIAPLGRDRQLHDRFVELVIHARRPTWGHAGEPVLPDTEATAVLGMMWHRLHHRDADPRPARPSPLDPQAIRQHIHDHLSEPLSLDRLAAAAHLSPAHFARLFKRHFRMTPMRYVNDRRIDAACALLAQTDMKLLHVAEAVGVGDPYYFSRLFRKTTGVSPSAYRQRHRVSGPS